MTATPGNQQFPVFINNDRFNGGTANQYSSVVDKNYIMVGGHIDTMLCDKIKKGEYIDFSRLLPWDRMTPNENRLELIQKGGQTFFVPAADRDGVVISSFYKWEQAFHVFSNIYLHEHPEKAMELTQYNHIICTASMSYAWDNVYQYDKEFRRHIGVFPNRSWAIILQQAWTLFLKDCLNSNGNHKQSNINNGKFHKKEACQHFNKGLCVAGKNCKYDRRCLECGKFGHGVHICRKRLQATSSGSTSNNATVIPNANVPLQSK